MAVNHPFPDRSASKRPLKPSIPVAGWGAPALALLLVACGSQAPTAGPPGPTPQQVPASVQIAGGTFTFGFATSRTSSAVTVAPFAISKTPVTVGHYKECVAVGACSAPALSTPVCAGAHVPVVEGPTYDLGASADGLPVTCTTPRQAAEYCSWLGGALPTIEQWLYAARGPSIQAFAWGNALPDCTRNQRALVPGGPGQTCCTRDECDPSTYYSVGQHPEVASPVGLLDVLLTPTELIRGQKGSPAGPCSGEGGACVVRGLIPAAIGFTGHVSDDINQGAYRDPGRVSGFRCVFEVKS